MRSDDERDEDFADQVAAMLMRRAGDIADSTDDQQRLVPIGREPRRRGQRSARPLLAAAASVVMVALGLLAVTQLRADNPDEIVTSVASQPESSAEPEADTTPEPDVDPGSAQPTPTIVPGSRGQLPSTGCRIEAPGESDPSDFTSTCAVQNGLLLHIVQPGDLLSAIARRYSVTLDALINANPDLDPDLIIEGQRLVIPTGSTPGDVCPPGFPQRADSNGDGVIDMCLGEIGATTDAEPTETETSAAEPAEALEDAAPRVYLPTGDWEVLGFSSELNAPPPVVAEGSRSSQLTLATDDGLFGPVVWAHFNPDPERIGFGPITPGRTRSAAIVTDGINPVAVFLIEGGGVVVNGYGIGKEDLLTVADAVAMVDGQLEWTGQPLPMDLAPVSVSDGPAPSVSNAQFSLGRGSAEGGAAEGITVMVVPESEWQMALQARASHPDAVPVQVANGPGIAYPYSATTGDDAGAVYVADGTIYLLRVARQSQDGPTPSTDEVRAILETVAEIPMAAIQDELGLENRLDLYTEWLNETPLPPDIDTGWLLADSPANVEQEAYYAHQVFRCLWVGEWIASGDPASLEQITASDGWPTAAVLTEFSLARGEAQVQLPGGPTIVDPTAATRAERATPALERDCGFVLGQFAEE